MKLKTEEMTLNIAEHLLDMFKGLSEKSASKMIKLIDEISKTLSKKFHKLQSKDCDKVEKKEEKMMKMINKEVKKQSIKAKVATIIATEKPVAMLALPIGSKNMVKKRTAKI